MRLRCIERYLCSMNTHEYRWQDMVISERRAPVDLVCALLTVLLLGFAFFGNSSDGRHLPPRTAIGPPVPVEQATSLQETAKPRVIPKRTEDWLARREITGP
jgi:hypothetical protein